MRILAIHSKSTEGATRRVAEILGDSIERFDMETNMTDAVSYQIIFWHNCIGKKVPGRYSIFYPCGMPTKRMLEEPEYRARVIDCAPNEIWANSRTAARCIRSIMPAHIGVRVMLKPFKLEIPAEPPVYAPKNKEILWYWKPNWPYTEPVNDYIADAMIRVASNGWRILVISNKVCASAPVSHPNIIPMGRVDLPAVLPDVYGVVRPTYGLDFGRSTYQVNAYGRWVMYCDMQEMGCIEVDWEHIPEGVDRAAVEWTQEHATGAWRYIKDNFTEEAMRACWLNALEEVTHGCKGSV